MAAPGREIGHGAGDLAQVRGWRRGAELQAEQVLKGTLSIELVVLNERTMASCDQQVQSPRMSPARCRITYINSTFMAVGSSGTVLTSSDGTTWTSRTSGVSTDLKKVTFGNSTFVAVGDTNTIITSSDGSSWTSRTGTGNLTEVTFGDDTFVIISGSGVRTSSDNGTTWDNRTLSGTFYGLSFSE